MLGKYGLGNRVSSVSSRGSDGSGSERLSSEDVRAQRFRRALEELGPTFAKLGQILSTRPDLLPPAFVRELPTLQDQVTPLTEARWWR